MFAATYAAQLAAQGVNITALAANAPSVLTQPLSFVEANVRPFDVPVATAVDFVGLIYLLVLTFFITVRLHCRSSQPFVSDCIYRR